MKKKLLGTLLFSVVLSSLAYAEADADKMRERMEEREKQQQGIIKNFSSVENSNESVSTTTVANLSPEEEKEAYEALDRVRARILKEDEERAEMLKATTEQQVQKENEVKIVE